VAARFAASRGASLPLSCITYMRAGMCPDVAPKLINACPSRARYHSGTGETPTSISSAVVPPSLALKRSFGNRADLRAANSHVSHDIQVRSRVQHPAVRQDYVVFLPLSGRSQQ